MKGKWIVAALLALGIVYYGTTLYLARGALDAKALAEQCMMFRSGLPGQKAEAEAFLVNAGKKLEEVRTSVKQMERLDAGNVKLMPQLETCLADLKNEIALSD